jgi:hypothetical protein
MLFWLSFVDNDMPAGARFLGVAIVDGDDAIDAVRESRLMGINPGGEVLIASVPEALIPRNFWNRLLNRQEAQRLSDATDSKLRGAVKDSSNG